MRKVFINQLFIFNHEIVLKIRERGKFWLRRIHLTEMTIQHLKKKIFEKYNDNSKGNIYSIYKLWDRKKKPIVNDSEVELLSYGIRIT